MSAPERNPELPDSLRPSRESVRETLIEGKIREAMDNGAFQGLPHQGRAIARVNAEAPTVRQHRRPLDLVAELDRLERAGRGEILEGC